MTRSRKSHGRFRSTGAQPRRLSTSERAERREARAALVESNREYFEEMNRRLNEQMDAARDRVFGKQGDHHAGEN